MKLLTGLLVIVIVAGATGADAWPWSRARGRNGKLPRPIDSPIVRPRQQAEKATRSKHPSKLQRQEWGAEWNKTLNVKFGHEGNHSLYLNE